MSPSTAQKAPQTTSSAVTLDSGIDSALVWLDENQDPAGYWVGMLETNCCIEAEWLLAMHVLGVEDDPKRDGMVRTILNAQRPDGAWQVYYDAPNGDMNATVECYAALRAYGIAADSPPLVRAREWILGHGGLGKIRVFTRYWLALIGEWPWSDTPSVPPEMIFFPSWFTFSIYNFSSWARATLIPLSILSSRRPVKPLPAQRRMDELFPEGRDRFDFSLPRRGSKVSWERLFLMADRILHGYRKLGINPGRENAIRACSEWIVRHQDADGAWGGIQPPWIYSLMALAGEGYELDHPVIAKGLSALDAHWSYEREGSVHIQASESPIWDTLLAVMAMQDCERDHQSSESMRDAVDWLLDQQVLSPGDWQVKVKDVDGGGWAFERANVHYPDIDDTAVALIVLARSRSQYGDGVRLDAAIARAVEWTLAMQCRNGGWAAFDRDNDKAILTKIPFCDFGEALDPPSVDVTAHVVEAFGLLGMGLSHPAVRRAVEYIRAEQEPDGCWFGRWGVNYIYGTAAVLPALEAVGEDMSALYIRTAADWIVAHQNRDGGWGETCASYMDPSLKGRGESTASQTGWALMSLVATSRDDYRDAIERGVEFLLTRQHAGTWDEPQYTGTGFPGYGVGARIDISARDLAERLQQGPELSRAFMINYNLYRHYFPLMALGRARRFLRASGTRGQ